MLPFSNPRLSTNPSSAWARTSTMAFPMATTSIEEPVALVELIVRGRYRDALDCGMVSEGDNAPGFALPDQDGRTVNLEDERGNWVVLWWYPKASTGG